MNSLYPFRAIQAQHMYHLLRKRYNACMEKKDKKIVESCLPFLFPVENLRCLFIFFCKSLAYCLLIFNCRYRERTLEGDPFAY